MSWTLWYEVLRCLYGEFYNVGKRLRTATQAKQN